MSKHLAARARLHARVRRTRVLPHSVPRHASRRRDPLAAAARVFRLPAAPPMCRLLRALPAAPGRFRAWHDFQLTSHLPFCFSAAYAAHVRLYELAALVALVVVCSARYHRNRERVGTAAYLDNAAASLLAVYGLLQLAASPSTPLLLVNAALACVTVAAFALPFFGRFAGLYPLVHPLGMHVVPALWTLNVAAFQGPLLRAR